MPLLNAFIAKNLTIYSCINIFKRPPSIAPRDDLRRPFPSISSCFPLHLPKFTTLTLSPSTTAPSSASTSDYEADAEDEPQTLDLSSAYASRRFFISSPGLSNSILDSTSSTLASTVEEVAEDRDSPDPYSDFRRSMEEMVEARDLHDVSANWDSLVELLLRYLALNPEHNHKFIAGAFADLLESLMSSPPPSVVASDGGVSAASTPPSCSCY